jgi:hypothetical protein
MRDAIPLLLLLVVAGCNPTPATVAKDPKANPFAAHALPLALRTWREGEVIERVPAGPYVYLRLRESGGRTTWLASLRATTPPSHHVRALIVGEAAHFRSARLGREFSPLAFAAVRSAAR